METNEEENKRTRDKKKNNNTKQKTKPLGLDAIFFASFQSSKHLNGLHLIHNALPFLPAPPLTKFFPFLLRCGHSQNLHQRSFMFQD